MTEVLTACPFCGSVHVSLNHYVQHGHDSYVVKCGNCGGRTAYWRKRTFAVEYWNRRAKDA